ncbi:MAG: CDP-diacylglycerol--glycerol-3-phosphate 3-phosphatidyltransferase [Firmicutes bacterium]|nr:CDP-diacylglycerol--glycerol-3-phosphate 3-phosphatidyltransferase [Erysipelotrichaceae bacterium]MDD7227407.1 CDP-diacylglycerol--glycerol-3-phosphate 3-phosphatidyltransferase [Bacillota bacterium]MDY4972348.1 CDP-diacylglycerol--glycerol-3-phosphate 3-phosphatidyltransferase [Erysipelotrichaceae bacterium]MDY5997968.1 CDP-diacylglycerol--glycerol-3-phosphate 3-phosphatidyltransferase [Erysipelotrichaceae bacterium]
MNLPNRLTIIRIIMIPVIVLIYLFPYAQFGINVQSFDVGFVSISLVNIIVLGLFILTSFTDFLDGYIARSQNMITTFGKFADPIADKLLVNTMFILFAAQGVIPVVPVLIMIARDTIVDGCRMIASSNGTVVAAGYLGKVKTVSQMLAIILILLNNLPFELYRFPVSDLVLWFAAIVSFVSGVSYFNQMKEYIFESK